MGYWLCAESETEDIKVNSWCWGATVTLIKQSNILEPNVEIIGERMVFAKAASCVKLADWLEQNVLAKISDDSRIKMDGEITTEPDDGTFHRADLAENYSVSKEWLLGFVAFLRSCGGFNTVG